MAALQPIKSSVRTIIMLEKYKEMLEDKTAIGELATFVPNKKLPVYNWLYFKEGFSKELVNSLAEQFRLQPGMTVLDPFCGSGTTLVACRELGIDSIGFDVLPLSVFAAHVKTRGYDTAKLKEASAQLFSQRFMKIKEEFPPIMKKAFSKYALEDISFFRRNIAQIEDDTMRNFFLLALISAAIRVSYAWKDGAVIKIRKSHRPPLRFMLKRTIQRMIKDAGKMKGRAQCTVQQRDARTMKLDDETIDAIITSPPYLNQIDYTKVYEIENLFIRGLYEKPPMRSYIGLESDTEFLPELDLPKAANAYFHDIHEVLEEMHRVCKPGAMIAIVVGNAYFPGRIVDSDLIICHLADSAGFKIDRISVLNTRYALEDRTTKKGVLRESMIIMHKS